MKLDDYKCRWEQKHALRAVYRDLYQRMTHASISGRGLEIGGGIGNLELTNENIVRLDIQHSLGVHVAADAHFLPFCDCAFSNVYLFDVLHHLECPLVFLAEAERVLEPGGRIIMIEPGITPFSHLMYGLGHEEPVDMNWHPRIPCTPRGDKNPYESNQAIPTLLFNKYHHILTEAVTNLRVLENNWLSLFAYPLSGGFQAWSLVPASWVGPLLKFEERLLPLVGRLMAFRMMIVMEKV